MKIINNNSDPRSTKAIDIPVGAVFAGRVGAGTDHSIFLRTYDNIVDLANPRNTWDVNHSYSLMVESFCELSATLTVGPKGTL